MDALQIPFKGFILFVNIECNVHDLYNGAHTVPKTPEPSNWQARARVQLLRDELVR